MGSFLVPRLEFLEGRINPSFANMDIIAQSLRLAEDALPQVPGLDASVGQMLPDRLSDLIGLNAYGNGANSWSQFDTLYPNPTVANLNTIANTIVSGSPYSSTITPTSGTTPSAGNALLSSLNYIQAGLLPDLMLGQYAGFTVQAWFNSTNIGTDWQRIIDLGNGASSNNIIVGVVGSQLFINSVGSGPNYIAGPTLASNTWYHVSAVFSGTTASVYLNGVLQLTLIGMPQTQNVARSGNYWGKSNWPGDAVWQGQQDELRFWNRALTASEIAANYNITYVIPQSGLLAYYKADESSGSIMNDSSGNGNTANYLNITGSNASSAPVYPQNGVQIQWSETGTYNSVFSTGGLDAGLHLSKSGNATLPITVSGQLGLTLSLEGAMLQTGISTSWTANAALTNLTLGVGLGYLDSSIEGGVYNLNTTISAALFDTVYKLSVPGPNITENNNGVPISPITNQVANTSDFSVASAANFPQLTGGLISVSANMPFTGQVGGLAFTSTPAVTLPQQTNISTLNYAQPQWNLSGFGDYLRLAQLNAQSLVTTGLNNAGGTLGALGQTSWQDVPFSSTNVGQNYDWTNGVTDASSRLFQNVYSIAGKERIQGILPWNNYGATFTIMRGSTLTTVTLSGNLTTDQPPVNLISTLIAAPIAYTLNLKLLGTGLGCREQPGYPGFLEFYAIDTSITGFTMDPLNSGVNGALGANALRALGFFGPPENVVQLQNGGFEGPLAVNDGNSWITSPINAQWTFVDAGISSGTNWYPAPPPEGLQAAFLENTGTVKQTLVNVDQGNYQLSFFAVGQGTNSVNPIQVLIDGSLVYSIAAPSLSGTTWEQFTTPAFALMAGNHTITFQGQGQGTSPVASALDNVKLLTATLTADRATYPTFTSFQGMLDTINQPNLIGQAATPVPLPGTDSVVGGVYINTGQSFTTATLPTAIQFVANAVGNSITPLLFSVIESDSTATYTLAAAAQTIAVSRAGLQTASLIFPGYNSSPTLTYVLGFSDSNLTVSGSLFPINPNGCQQNPFDPLPCVPAGLITTNSQNAGTIGNESTSGTGNWLFSSTSPSNLVIGSTFGGTTSTVPLMSSPAGTPLARSYALAAYQGLAQAGSGSVSRPNTDGQLGPVTAPPISPLPQTDSAFGGVYINTGQSFQSISTPVAIQFIANILGNTITPLLFSVNTTGSSPIYTLVLAAQSIPVTITGLQTHNLVLPTFSLSSTDTYLLGYTDRSMTVSATSITTTGTYQGTIGMDTTTNTQANSATSGTWISTNLAAGFSFSLGNTFGNSGATFPLYQGVGTVPALRPYAFSAFISSPQTNIYTGASYNTSFLPTSIRFYANTGGQITPMLFTTAGNGTYTVAAIGESITVPAGPGGMVNSPVYFPNLGSLVPGTTYLFGYQNQSSGVVALQSGASTAGGWVSSDNPLPAVGYLAAFSPGGIYSMDIIASQTAGSPVLENPTYQIPAVFGFGGNGTGWTVNTGTDPAATVSDDVLNLTFGPFYDNMYMFNSIWNNTPFIGLASSPWISSFTYTPDSTNSLTLGASFIIQGQGTSALGNPSLGNFSYGTGINPSVMFSWNNWNEGGNPYDGTTIGVGTGGEVNFTDWTGSYEGDYSANGINMSNYPPTNVVLSYDGVGNITVFLTQGANTFTKTYAANLSGLDSNAYIGFVGGQNNYTATTTISNFQFLPGPPFYYDSANGQVVINPDQLYGGTNSPPVVPTAMQLFATVPSTGSGWITPLLFQVGGSMVAPTYSLVGVATSQEITNTGLAPLPVEFEASLLSTLDPAASFVVGFSNRDVKIGTGGSFSTISTFGGMINKGIGGTWLTSSEISQNALQLGTQFSVGTTPSNTELAPGINYAVTFFTDATQYQNYSSLASIQYSQGQQVYVSYADIHEDTTNVNISADAINKANVPHVSDLSLIGSEDVEVAVTATRQFTLLLDSSVFTQGATLTNSQEQANANPLTTGVLTSITVQPGSQPFGVDGFLSQVITVVSGTQTYFAPPVITITDRAGNSLNSTTMAPSYGTIPSDLGLGQFDGFTVQSWFNAANSTVGVQKILDLGSPVNTLNNITLGINNNGLFLGVGGITYSSTATLASNQWYHASVVVSGTSAKIYINGLLSDTFTIVPVTNVSRPNNYWGFGNMPTDQPFRGQLEELRLWNRALLPSEIVANFSTPFAKIQPGLLAYYKADEPSGSTLLDSSGNGINATLSLSQNRITSTAPIAKIGYGATAVADIDPNTGLLVGITLTNPGSGYANPILTLAKNLPATGTVRLGTNQSIASIQVVNGGQFYASAPAVTLTDSAGIGSGALATATIVNGVVTSINVTNAGSGYVNPVLTIAPPTTVQIQRDSIIPLPSITITDIGGGSGAMAKPIFDLHGFLTGVLVTGSQATASITLGNQGAIGSITLLDGGQFYLTPPTVTITDNAGSGTGALALATIDTNGMVSAISLVTFGNGYIDPVVTLSAPEVINSGYVKPVLTFSNNTPATATATIQNGGITAITISNGGQYYGNTAPRITISGGGGSGAIATATLANGVVTAITLNNGGSGYSSIPSISLDPPITATANVTMGVGDALITYVGKMYTNTPNITITDSTGFGTGASGYAVIEGGQLVDIVMTNYGTGYTSPLVTIDPPTVDISQKPSGPSQLNHVIYFIDGNMWSTTTSSSQGLNLQYQIIDQLVDLENQANFGLSGGNVNTTPGYYNLAAYLSPLVNDAIPTYAQTSNLSIVMPKLGIAPLLWYVSAAKGSDPYLSQGLFINNSWSVATLGKVSLGNIDLFMNLSGNNSLPGFTGSAQVGYVDVNLVADNFDPDVDFSLETTPGSFKAFSKWYSILGNDSFLGINAKHSSTINSYDLTLNALVSQQVSNTLGTVGSLPVTNIPYVLPYFTIAEPYTPSSTTYPIPNITLSVDSFGTGTFSNSNFGTAEGLLYIDKSNLGNSFSQVSTALELTDNSSYLGNLLPFVGGTPQDITGFSDYFTVYVDNNLVAGIPDDLDSLIDWVTDNSSTFSLGYGQIVVGQASGTGLYLTPLNWSDSVSATTTIAFDVGTYASLAGGFNTSNLPSNQSDLIYTIVPPQNTGDLSVTMDASWQTPFGMFLTQTGSGTSLAYNTAGYIAKSPNNAWNLEEISISANDLDFQGTLGTLALYFESDTEDTAWVSLTNGAISTNLSANQLATSVITSSLTGSVNGGTYAANLPVYYPTVSCYSGNFNISGVNNSPASVISYMAQEALYTAQFGPGGAITGFTQYSGGTSYATAPVDRPGAHPQVLITDAAGVGSGATAVPLFNPLIGIPNITSGGTGYTSAPTVIINDPTGLNATATATINAIGVVTGITLNSGGTGYSKPTITIMGGGGSGATATFPVGSISNPGVITGITLLTSGSGYQSPVVAFAGFTRNSTNPTVSQSVTFGLPDMDNDDIASLSLANAIDNPNIFISGLGSMAAALASVYTSAIMESQIIIGTGTGQFAQAFGTYNSIADFLAQMTPFVPQCDQDATASAKTTNTGAIDTITVITTGESYSFTPSVTILDTYPGVGSGATAVANMVSDGNGGLKVGSIILTNPGLGYSRPVVLIQQIVPGQLSPEAQLYNVASTAYNKVLSTPGLILDPSLQLTPGTYTIGQSTTQTTGSIPTFRDASGNILTYSPVFTKFLNLALGAAQADVEMVEFPLIIDYTLPDTTIPFALGLPGLPLAIHFPSVLNLIEHGTATVDLSFGVDAFNGFYIIPNPVNQFSGIVNAGPASNFNTTINLGVLSGSMSADTGDIFSMPFTSVLTDPNLDAQLTLSEINSLTPSSMFNATFGTPTVGLDLDFELKVAGGGVAAAIPSIGNTMSISWTPGQGAPTVSYNNFYINLGSFISDYMGQVATRLLPITNGVQPILGALETPLPIIGSIIGGNASLLGLASRFGDANTAFITSLESVIEMIGDITSAVNYITQNPGVSYQVPIDVVATFTDDFRTPASGLGRPHLLSALPNLQHVIDVTNGFLNSVENEANDFTRAATKILNQLYGDGDSGLGITFDILDPINLVNLVTGEIADIFHINFPTLSGNFSIGESFELYGPLFMTFGGGVNAAVNLALGFDTAGLIQWTEATIGGSQGLSETALEGLARDVLLQGFFVDAENTSITANGYLDLGVELNLGIIRGGVEGIFNVDMSMTPNGDASGRLNLQEMIQLAGTDFSSPLNLFDFEFTGSISADAYVDFYFPFSWHNAWSHNFGSYTIFHKENDPTPPTEQAASNGSLYLNMGPTAGRRSQTGKIKDEHFEIRHLGGRSGDESLSLQLFVNGKAQYVDQLGKPSPQVYHNIDKVVGIAGDGDDTIDCTGVLSPTYLLGGDGQDTLLGGLGINHLDGGNGKDTLQGGPLADTILGGEGTDQILGGGGIDFINGGNGDDAIGQTVGNATYRFDDHFGNDIHSPSNLEGSVLDFTAVTENLTVTLGSTNTIQIGNNSTISWAGAGPKSILLGQGEDKVIFNQGYSSTSINPGNGRDRFQIMAFEPETVVNILNGDADGDNQILVKTNLMRDIGVNDLGLTANGALFQLDWSTFRKLNIIDPLATVTITLGQNAPDKLVANSKNVVVLSPLDAKQVRLEATNLLSVQADISAAKGGAVALISGPKGVIKIATEKNATLSTINGNIFLKSPIAYVGGQSTNLTVLPTNGIFEDEVLRTIRTAPEALGIFGIVNPIIVSAMGGTINITDPKGAVQSGHITPFPKFGGETRFNAMGDFNVDGINDILAVPGPGGGPNLKVISGKDLKVIKSIYVFQSGFTGGLNVATGDVNGDGFKDIIIGTDAGAGPHVKVYSGKDYSVLRSFYAFSAGFRGGVRVASADTNGDGLADIIVSTASGSSSHVKVFSGLDNTVLSSFFAFKINPKSGGTFVSTADLNGDGRAEIISGMGAGNAPQVSVYNSATKALDTFMAYGQNFLGGVRVAAITTANGKAVVVTGSGPGGGPNVRTFDAANKFKLIDSFFAGPKDNLSGVIL